MKRLSVWLVAALLLAAGSGCRCCNWFHRGPQCGAPAAPAAPACASSAGYDPYVAPPALNTAPPVYQPAPG